MDKITATQFIELLFEDFEVSNKEITGGVVVKDFNLRESSALIRNCVFSSIVVFTNCNLGKFFIIEDCIFRDKIAFDQFTMHEGSQAFLLNNCTITGELAIVKNCSFHSSPLIRKTSIGILRISNLNVTNGGFGLENSTINTIFQISRIELRDNISLENCTVKGNVWLERSKVESVDISNSHFEKLVTFFNLEVRINIVIGDTRFDEQLSIEANQVKSIHLLGGDFNQEVKISNKDHSGVVEGRIEELYLEGGSFNDGFTFNSNGIDMDLVSIKSSYRLKGSFYLNECKSKSMSLKGDSQNNYIIFTDPQVASLKFDAFTNLGTLIFSGLMPLTSTSDISISHSNLGNTSFFNADLSKFAQINIANSIVRNISTANVKWFKYDQLNLGELRFEMNRDIYRQLKQAMEQQGDRIQSLKFKGFEMKEYRKSLTPISSINSWQEVSDRVSIFLNEWSNDNGQNWIRPISLTIAITFLSYVLLLFVLDPNVYLTSYQNCEEASAFFKCIQSKFHMFFMLLNPTIGAKDLLGIEKDGAAPIAVHFILFIQKIALAYLLFQTIAAFRKYLK